jgi:SOS-response transcriptional repressor LexA
MAGRPRVEGLTRAERDTCESLYEFWKEHGRGPTLTEMSKRLGYASHSGALGQLNIAALKGYAIREPGRARVWRVTEKFLEEKSASSQTKSTPKDKINS